MSEAIENKIPEGQQTAFRSGENVLEKFAENLSQKREQAKTEALKKEPVAEVKAEDINKDAPVAESPKEPSSNGQSQNPKKEVEPITPEPEVKQDDESWRKELGFGDTAEVKVEDVKKDNAVEKLREYEARIKELEEIANEPLVSAYHAAKKSGKDVPTFIREVAGVDINSLTPEQIWDANLKAEGFTLEEIAADLEKFRELSPVEQKLKVKPFKQELITQQHEQLKKYASDNTLNAANSEKDKQALVTMFQEQGKKFFEKIKDTDWQGVKMTPSEISKLQNYIEKDFKFVNADGTANYELYAKVANYALNERTILTNTYKKGDTKGYERALLEFSRTSNNDKRFNSAPEVKTTNKSEQAKKASKEAFSNA